MKVVGLTGGIASGKSTVSNQIKEFGIPIIDADKIAREIVKPDSKILNEIALEFGSDILSKDGTLNRKKLGGIVFNDPFMLEKLNNITHPVIRKEILLAISRLRESGEKICVVDAAILIEGKFTDLVDYIILIYVDVKNQISRLISRDNISEGEALKRINSQMTFEEKRVYADFVLDNNKNLEYTKKQLNNIINELLLLEDANV